MCRFNGALIFSWFLTARAEELSRALLACTAAADDSAVCPFLPLSPRRRLAGVEGRRVGGAAMVKQRGFRPQGLQLNPIKRIASGG